MDKVEKNAVDEMLRNPIYIVKVSLKSQIFDGQHGPIIDTDLWDQVQHVLQQRSTRRGNPPIHTVRSSEATLIDLAYCWKCGSRMSYMPRNRTQTKGYYICSARVKSSSCMATMVRADSVDQQLLSIAQQIAIPTEWHPYIIDRAFKLMKKASLRNLRLDFVDERISDHEYRREKQRLETLQDGKQPAERQIDLQSVIGLLSDLPALLERATAQERHAIYLQLFERVLIGGHEVKKNNACTEVQSVTYVNN